MESEAHFKLRSSPTLMVGPDNLRKKDNRGNVGGFLLVRCDRATENSRAKLAFEFFDENGASLYTWIK